MSGHARLFACMLTRRALPIGGGAPPNADLCRNTVRGDPPSSTSTKPKRFCRFQLTSTALHSPVEGSPVGGVGALLSQVRPSLPRPVPPPIAPPRDSRGAKDNAHVGALARTACILSHGVRPDLSHGEGKEEQRWGSGLVGDGGAGAGEFVGSSHKKIPTTLFPICGDSISPMCQKIMFF